MTGSGRGSSGSASVSPIVISGIPATATISPGPAAVGRDAVERLGGVQLGDARPLDGAVGAAPGDGAPLAQRSRANAAEGEASDVRRGIEVGDERLQGHRRIERRRRDALDEEVEQRGQGQPVGEPGAVGWPLHRRPALAGHAIHGREVELVHGGVEVEEQLLDVVDDLGDAGVGTVDLVDHEDHGELRLERLAEHEAGLRERALAGVDEEEDAVDHRQCPLDLAAEVGVAGSVDDVDRHGAVAVAVADRRVLGEDRDALLALEVHRVHDPIGDVLVGAERPGLPQHLVDERRLAVVDVGDDGDVAQVIARLHDEFLPRAAAHPRLERHCLVAVRTLSTSQRPTLTSASGPAGQGDRRVEAAAGAAMQGGGAAAGRGEVGDDRQPDPRALVAGVGSAPEPLEGMGQLLVAQSRPAIEDVDAHRRCRSAPAAASTTTSTLLPAGATAMALSR